MRTAHAAAYVLAATIALSVTACGTKSDNPAPADTVTPATTSTTVEASPDSATTTEPEPEPTTEVPDQGDLLIEATESGTIREEVAAGNLDGTNYAVAFGAMHEAWEAAEEKSRDNLCAALALGGKEWIESNFQDATPSYNADAMFDALTIYCGTR